MEIEIARYLPYIAQVSKKNTHTHTSVLFASACVRINQVNKFKQFR